MIALVAGYSLSTEDDESVALDTEASAALSASPDPTDPPTTTSNPDPDDEAEETGEGDAAEDVADGERSDLRAVSYALSLDDIGDAGDALSFADGDSSSSDDDPPASPTTQATQPAVETTVIDQSGSSTSVVNDTTETTATETTDTTAAGDEGGDTTTSETTAPAETTTTAAPSANPDGYVDAGHGVFVPPILIEIRRCESTHNYQAANPSSTARGAYQFLRSSWAAYGHADRYGVSEAHLATNAQQDEAALITWQRDGTRPWNASRSCWG